MVRDRPMTMRFGLGTWPSARIRKYALYDDGSFVNQAHDDWAQWAVEGRSAPVPGDTLAVVAMLALGAARSLWGIN